MAVAEKGKFQYPGTGRNYLPFVHVNDLAQAYVLAAENPPVGHVINVVDDKPIALGEMAEKLLNAFNGGKASSVPTWLVDLFSGSALTEMLTGSYRVQNDKVKRILQWEPKYKTFDEGISDVVFKYKKLQSV